VALVLVLVGEDEGAVATTSWAARSPLPFSFDAQDHRTAQVVLVTTVTSPLPVTASLTSASAHVPFVTAPLAPTGGEAKTAFGALFQVRVDSDHPLDAVPTSKPAGLLEPA
jgi:hypothetical protein